MNRVVAEAGCPNGGWEASFGWGDKEQLTVCEAHFDVE
jgi:hypothetical protein